MNLSGLMKDYSTKVLTLILNATKEANGIIVS